MLPGFYASPLQPNPPTSAELFSKEAALVPEAVLAPGARIECRSAEWLVRSLCRSSDGQQVVDVVGVSPFLKEKEARFLVDVKKAAGSFKVLQPEETALGSDTSPRYRTACYSSRPGSNYALLPRMAGTPATTDLGGHGCSQ